MPFDIYTDTGLTSAAPSPLQVSHNSDFSDNPQDFQYYIGSLDADRKIEANSNPGVDNIVISVADTSPASGHETTEILLATTQLGLDSATPGASLTVGTSVTSGTGNKYEFWVRVVNAVSTVGISTELSFTTNSVKESSTV